MRCDTGEQSFYLGRPRKLAFEYIDGSPANSFFLMDLNTLKPSGIYENVQSESEQLMEVDEEYHDYGIWDRGFMGYDHEDREIPIPDEASVVVRLLRGKILIVAKASHWNHETGTYDGRHEHMMAEDNRHHRLGDVISSVMMLADDVRPVSHVAPHEVATVETSIPPLAEPENYLLDARVMFLAIWLS
ncbi:hypothetical protein EOA25_28635 [Mesorhizobium sp. M2A.F.Ca.ET.040.01.1.1]|nr:hypothetical protein EOA25_28635 [Mesorhizobium sp. M2A.F.Ca.ET.040.01.1.1]